MFENNTRRFVVYGDHVYAERDKKGAELKRRLSLARASRNKTEVRRIEKQLKFLGIPV